MGPWEMEMVNKKNLTLVGKAGISVMMHNGGETGSLESFVPAHDMLLKGLLLWQYTG